MAFHLRPKPEDQGDLDDITQEDVIKGRTKGSIVIELSLKPEEINDFKKDLEALCNKYLNI